MRCAMCVVVVVGERGEDNTEHASRDAEWWAEVNTARGALY